MSTHLVGCNIIERDINNETLWTWAFPSVTKAEQNFVMRKYLDIGSQAQAFVFAKNSKKWSYIYTTQVFETDNLPQVKQFALVVWAKDYNPEKYETLCRILSKRYCKTGDPTVILQLYLSVMTKGVCTTEENGTFLTADFESVKNNVNTQIKDLIKLFGLEIILIYTALLLNKRLIVYHHSLESLLKCVRSLPYLMIHRSFDGCIFPWLHLVQDELVELKRYDGYIAGCTNNGVGSRIDLYDILINLPAREITISLQTKDSFVMTKTHKDIALFMVQLAENPSVEEKEVIDEISSKTRELLTQLRSLATISTSDGRKLISIETLREKNLAPALENFLFNLSVAENMIML